MLFVKRDEQSFGIVKNGVGMEVEKLHMSVRGPYYYGFPFIPIWLGNDIHYQVCDQSILFPNFNDTAVGAREWIGNFMSYFVGYIFTYPYWD